MKSQRIHTGLQFPVTHEWSFQQHCSVTQKMCHTDDKSGLVQQNQPVICWQLTLEEADREELEVAEELRKRKMMMMMARMPAKVSLMMLRETHDQGVSRIDGGVLNMGPERRRMCPFQGVVRLPRRNRGRTKRYEDRWVMFLRIQVT